MLGGGSGGRPGLSGIPGMGLGGIVGDGGGLGCAGKRGADGWVGATFGAAAPLRQVPIPTDVKEATTSTIELFKRVVFIRIEKLETDCGFERQSLQVNSVSTPS